MFVVVVPGFRDSLPGAGFQLSPRLIGSDFSSSPTVILRRADRGLLGFSAGSSLEERDALRVGSSARLSGFGVDEDSAAGALRLLRLLRRSSPESGLRSLREERDEEEEADGEELDRLSPLGRFDPLREDRLGAIRVVSQ